MEDDLDFKEIMRKNKVLKQKDDGKFVHKNPKTNFAKKPILNRRLKEPFEDDSDYFKKYHKPVTPDEVLEFFDKLSKEEIRILKEKKDACEKIDLHGFTEERALDELKKVLYSLNKFKDCRFLEVVHGKGKGKDKMDDELMNYPVVKNAVNELLRNKQFVKGFCSTLQKNGARNPGSIIVMLNL